MRQLSLSFFNFNRSYLKSVFSGFSNFRQLRKFQFLETTELNNCTNCKALSVSFSVSFSCDVRNSSNMSAQWKPVKDSYLKMSTDEKRSVYRCGGKYVTLSEIPTWKDYSASLELASSSIECKYAKNDNLNNKVSMFVGDITVLEVDAIVNAANNKLRGGGGVDGAIHRAAGPDLLAECVSINHCPTGEARITGGYKLPAKYVIHTVGPVGEKPDSLKGCYESSLQLAKGNSCQSVAFPCISTGIYGYPNEKAAHVALNTVRIFLEDNADFFSRIVFCLFLDCDIKIYQNLMPQYFPV